MNTLAIIQARLNSTRFPGKVLADLAGRSVLGHVVDQVRQARRIDQIVVATCYPGGGAIAGHCEALGVPYYIHEEEDDVLRRFAFCASIFDPELIVRVCADNPLIWPEGLDRLVAAINDEPRRKRHYDYAAWEFARNRPAILEPNGYFAEIMTREALDRAERECPIDHYDGAELREHVTKYIYENPDRFACRWLRVPKWYRDQGSPHHAVDTPEDLEEVSRVIHYQASVRHGISNERG